MSTNRISVTIPDQVKQDALSHLAALEALLKPYVQTLTPEERHDLPKMSEKTISFVSKISTNYTGTNPEFTPAFVDINELRKDYAVVAQLQDANNKLEQIFNQVNDTLLLAGSEAYSASLMYYANVKLAAKSGQPNAKSIFEDLKQRFEILSQSKKAAAKTDSK
jgi:hypothetical protein